MRVSFGESLRRGRQKGWYWGVVTVVILAFCVLKTAYSLIQSGHIAKAISFTGQNTLGIYAINGLFIFTVPAIIGIDYRFGLPLWIYALVMTAFLLGVTCLMRRIPIVRHLFLGEK